MLALMHLRGWRDLNEEILIGLASDWTERWWDHPLGPNAFVIEANPSMAASDTTLDPPARSDL